MNKDNAHLYLPLVAALATGKEIQFRPPLKLPASWANMEYVNFLNPPECYRIKPEFTPPPELFFNELDGGALGAHHHETREAAVARAEGVGAADRTHVVRFRLDDSYTPPNPVSGFLNVYPEPVPWGFHPTVGKAKWAAEGNCARTAKMVEVLPRIVYRQCGSTAARRPELETRRFRRLDPTSCCLSFELPRTMEYTGKLYGKIGRRMIPLTLTSQDVDEMERQRDAAVMLAGELVAIIRVNAMRGTWAEATPEQVDEFLVPWIAKLRVVQGHSPDNDQAETPL